MKVTIGRPRILWIFILTLTTILAENDERRCLMLDNTEGWLCIPSRECIWKDWICDGNEQCPDPDKSDEIEGCDLFPETGCRSWNGKKHERLCEDDRCVQFRSECDTTINNTTENGTWRCHNGLLIYLNEVCDGTVHCKDRSDEIQGCELFSNTGCKSLYGQRHVRCYDTETSRYVCTLPEFEECRRCLEKDRWRCDDGRCIEADKLSDGIKDCIDGSDESSFPFNSWTLFFITLCITILGLSLSFLYRFINYQKRLFFCETCRTIEARKIHKEPKFDIEGWESISTDVLDSGCFPEEIDTESVLPSELINFLEDETNWRSLSLCGHNEVKGQRLYAKVHQQPILFRNLYYYLVFRYPKAKKLSKVTRILHQWEMILHGQDFQSVQSCWRLNLGCCENFKTVISSIRNSTEDSFGGFAVQINERYLDIKNWFRNLRRHHLPENSRSCTETIYTIIKTIYYSLSPLLSASFLYFDISKDVCFAVIVYTSLYDIAKGRIWCTDYTFELCLVFYLFLSLLLVQTLYSLISGYYSSIVFEMCTHTKSKTKIVTLRCLSVLFAPFMPAFIIANHAYYTERSYTFQRELQQTRTSTKDRDRYRIFLFTKVLRMRYRSSLFQRIYSFYRIVQAVVGSVSVIVVLVLILFVSTRSDRPINLMNGVEEKIASFFDIVPDKSGKFRENDVSSSNAVATGGEGGGAIAAEETDLLTSLNLVRDVVFITAIGFSFFMIITALTRYVFQNKVRNMTFMGQVTLSAYYVCHTVCRLTVIIALFSTAEADPASLSTTPVIPLFPAAVISFVLFVVQFLLIYTYNVKFVDEFRKTGNIVEKLVHVLVNTLVVIPYTSWDVERYDVDSENTKNRKEIRGIHSYALAEGSNTSKSVFDMMSLVNGPLIMNVGNVQSEIEKVWWMNPKRNLRFEETISHLPPVLRSTDPRIVRETLQYLEDNGFINKPLYNPRRTKREYFWLLLLHLLLNVFSLIVELSNGGKVLQSGNHYYSWDIRLSTFGLGIVFLVLYYSRYHVDRGLMDVRFCGFCWRNFPVLCCLATDPPVKAILVEEEIQRLLCDNQDDIDRPTSPNTNTVMTQTSFIDTNTKKKTKEGEEEEEEEKTK